MATTMMLKFQKYWEDCSLILTVALVLDPRFKIEYVDYTYRQLYGDGAAFIHTERVRSYLYELYSEYAVNSDKNESTHGDDMFESNEAKKLKGGFKKFMNNILVFGHSNKLVKNSMKFGTYSLLTYGEEDDYDSSCDADRIACSTRNPRRGSISGLFRCDPHRSERSGPCKTKPSRGIFGASPARFPAQGMRQN
ncbi:hypothetical protein QJS10_CPB11g00627 [Acorus calamus]|uniref:hAT-like transposase RNase-H fold domain-containing protein n=1 Tax=Acorus calamus TaxID=4465 RepID=A0AAV9DXF7_ACOCL|nr:hypothetical protein QJS10_CPB11g00627 [Acorus calamus]